jgi:N-methylhydantoinase A
MNDTRLRIAVDIGGTFTDGVAEEMATGRIRVAKALTTPDDPGEAVTTVVDDLLRQIGGHRSGRAAEDVSEVVHGTTLVTNTLIERKGAATALLVTEGTRDLLDIRREVRYDLYDLDLQLPEPLVPPERRHEVRERFNATGEVLVPLDDGAVKAALEWLDGLDVQAVAVCFLHAYDNDGHERAMAEALERRFPDLAVSLSSRVAREIREYERMTTTTANAYVQPLFARYIGELESRLAALGIRGALRIMVSSGGFTSTAGAAEVPILLLESGPAGGALSAAKAGREAGFPDVIAFDMGGTTAKSCVIKDGEASLAHTFEAARVHRFKRGSGLPLLIPSMDLIEIGAGGGSIASVSPWGTLSVGPQSAGAVPGPACYSQGGEDATVTDADLLLGYLHEDHFLGGEMLLRRDRAEAALARLGERLGMSVTEAAWGIHNVVNENMASAARVHIAEKGLDPRAFTLVATGGAGPVHAVEVAHKLRIGRVLCPIAAGAGSCLGFLSAPARVDRSWSRKQRFNDVDWTEVDEVLRELRRDAETELQGATDVDVQWLIGVDVRYAGQGDAVTVELPYRIVNGDFEPLLRQAFDDRYRDLYGRNVPDAVPEVVTWRLTGCSSAQGRRFVWESHDGDGTASRRQSAYLTQDGGFDDVDVYDRYALPAGTVLRGPAIVEERESTLVVPVPGTITVLNDLSVLVELEKP